MYYKSIGVDYSRNHQDIFALIAPSPIFDKQLVKILEQSTDETLRPWIIQGLLVRESLKGWLPFMASLDEGLREIVSLIS